MLEKWNDSSILPPPVLTFQCNSTFDTNGLHYACNDMIRVLSKQSPLHKEAAMVSRLLYKYDKKFRNDIGYRNFKKVNTALRRYLTLNFLKDVEGFSSILPSDDSEELYLPSRQMLEYLLVRLQTFSKIMLRICVCSKQTAVFYMDRIKRGESHWMSLMPYAVLSRVWSMSSVLINHSCSWYNQLHTFLNKLQSKGIPFLPTEYMLPKDLSEWLDVNNIDEFGKYEWSVNRSIQVVPILEEIEETDNEFDIFKYITEINEEPEMESVANETKTAEINIPEVRQFKLLQKVDQGQKVSRESFMNSVINKPTEETTPSTPLTKQNDKISQLNEKMTSQLRSLKMFKDKDADLNIAINKEGRSKKHCMEKVTSTETLKEFLKTEEKYRNDDNAYALTRHLSFMQWQALKGALAKLCNLVGNNRKIQRKFEKIWKDKCLDYL